MAGCICQRVFFFFFFFGGEEGGEVCPLTNEEQDIDLPQLKSGCSSGGNPVAAWRLGASYGIKLN